MCFLKTVYTDVTVPPVLLQWLIFLVRISSAALVWCFPSTGFLSLHARWSKAEGTMAVVDDLCPGRPPLGWTFLGRAHWEAQKNGENPAVTLLSLPFCLGSDCWEIHPTPWFARRALTAPGPVCVLIYCHHFISSVAFSITPFYSAPLGEKQWGENEWKTNNEMCENPCVGKGAFLGGPARHDPQGRLCCDSWPREHCPG